MSVTEIHQLPMARKILFIGSGLSSNLGMPSWGEILQQVGQELKEPSDRIQLAALVEPPNPRFYEVADLLADLMGRDALEDATISAILNAQRKILQEASLAGWTALLRKFKPCGIVTTNWDTLLTEVTGFRQLAWPRDARELARALRDNIPFVLYLHGNVDTRPIAITTADCERVAATLGPSDATLDLTGVLSMHYVVVVGYSFPDPHIRHVFKLAEEFAGQRGHVIVARRKEDSDGQLGWMPTQPVAIEFRSYDRFRETLVELASYCEPSSSIQLITSVDNSDDLRTIIEQQPYDFASTWSMRHAFLESSDVHRLLEWTAELVAGEEFSSARSLGIGSTMLSTMSDRWDPPATVLRRLEKICMDAVHAGDTSKMGVVEPLAFAVSRKGLVVAQRIHLRELIDSRAWRSADISRAWEYYQTADTQIAAIRRHLDDPFRGGTLRANDLGRILGLLTSEPESLRPSVESLLHSSLQALKASGEEDLVRVVVMEAERYRNDRIE